MTMKPLADRLLRPFRRESRGLLARRLVAETTGRISVPPEIAVIEVTNRCNLDCIMCYRRDHLGEPSDMDWEVFCEAIKCLAGADQVWCQGGGEPLLHPRILDMISYAHVASKPTVLSLVTNGTLLRGELAVRLAASRLTSLTVSIDAADPDLFARIRGTSLTRILDNVRAFTAISQIPVVVQFTTMEQNLDELPAMPSVASEIGARRLNVQYVLALKSNSRARQLDAAHARFAAASDRTLEAAAAVGIECTIPPIPAMIRCDLPFRQVFVRATGELAPCCVAIHLAIENDVHSINGRNIRRWRMLTSRGNWPTECMRFCYVRRAVPSPQALGLDPTLQ